MKYEKLEHDAILDYFGYMLIQKPCFKQAPIIRCLQTTAE
uniref:Brk1 n=1 Tax=Arundo donax TaxID=35708 RepID=A0A0A9F7L2_ARUDO